MTLPVQTRVSKTATSTAPPTAASSPLAPKLPREAPAVKYEIVRSAAKGPPGPRVRVNQVLRGEPARIIIALKNSGHFRTTSQAVNEAVILLGDADISRRLKIERLKTLENEKE